MGSPSSAEAPKHFVSSQVSSLCHCLGILAKPQIICFCHSNSSTSNILSSCWARRNRSTSNILSSCRGWGVQRSAEQAPVDGRCGLECGAEAGHDPGLMCGSRRPSPSTCLPQRYYWNGRCQTPCTGAARVQRQYSSTALENV